MKNFRDLAPTICEINSLLDRAKKHCHCKNDAALCRYLEIAPPVISKLRHGRIGLCASLVIRLIETGMPLTLIKGGLS